MTTYEAFISYRRKGGQELATSLNRILEEDYGISSFYDNEELHFGDFRMQLIKNNLFSRVLIVLLSPGALDRCRNKGDWVYREIALFLRLRKPVILVKYPGFTFPGNLPTPLQKLKSMPCLDFDGLSYKSFAHTIVAKLRKGWVPKPKTKFFEKEIARQQMHSDKFSPQQRAEKLATRLLHRNLISRDEVATVHGLAPFYADTIPASKIAAFLCSTLYTHRLNAACNRAKLERKVISENYGDTVQNGDRDYLSIKTQRKKAWQAVLRRLLPSIFLVPLCIMINPDELVTFIPLVLGAPMLYFGIPEEDASDILQKNGLWGRLWRFVKPSVLGVFLPFVLVAILASFLPEPFFTVVEVTLVCFFAAYSGAAVLLLLHRLVTTLITLLNSRSRFLSRIWLHRLRLERWNNRMRLPQLLMLIVFLGLCVLGALLLHREGKL